MHLGQWPAEGGTGGGEAERPKVQTCSGFDLLHHCGHRGLFIVPGGSGRLSVLPHHQTGGDLKPKEASLSCPHLWTCPSTPTLSLCILSHPNAAPSQCRSATPRLGGERLGQVIITWECDKSFGRWGHGAEAAHCPSPGEMGGKAFWR